MWEILLLDFFAVGDCVTGLFCCGRFYCWTFLLWEILMLDFLASGQMNRQAPNGPVSGYDGVLQVLWRAAARGAGRSGFLVGVRWPPGSL